MVYLINKRKINLIILEILIAVGILAIPLGRFGRLARDE